MTEVGKRVVAIMKTDPQTAWVFGHGVYVGNEPPMTAGGWMGKALAEAGRPNPKLLLDSGKVVWGCECWWGAETVVLARLGSRSIVEVDIDAEREKWRVEDEARQAPGRE